MVILRGFPYNSALFGLALYLRLCKPAPLGEKTHQPFVLFQQALLATVSLVRRPEMEVLVLWLFVVVLVGCLI